MAAGVAAVAAVGYAAMLVVSPHVSHNGIDSALAPGVADAQSLVLLANHVAAAPVKATPRLCSMKCGSNEETFTGADLYLDNGRYYYAETSKACRQLSKRVLRTTP